MQIDNGGNNAAAARQAAIEAARRAAEAAARRAAEAAARRAAAEAAAKAAARQAANAAKPANPFGLPSIGLPAPTGTLKAPQAKAQADSLKQELKAAKTPEDLDAVSVKADQFAKQVQASADPEVRQQAPALLKVNEDIQRANDGVQRVEAMKASLHGAPEQQADQTAALLSRPKTLTGAVGDMKALEGSPLADAMKQDTRDIAKEATPEALAKQLQADPYLSDYPPTMANNLVALKALQDPALSAAVDKVGETLLRDAAGSGDNPIEYADIQRNPDLVRLIAPFKDSPDPALREQFQATVNGWGTAILNQSLEGKKGKDGVKDAIGDYQDRVLKLAELGLDAETVNAVASDTVKRNRDQIENHAKDHGGGVGGWLHDRVDDVADFVGDLIGGAIDFVADKAGDVVKAAAHFFYEHVVDPALDNSALGEDTDAFKNEKLGIMGDLVTNRLEVGESAFVKLDVSAKIAGVALGAGAELEIKRVPKLGADGEPLPPIDGVPQTNLEVHVLAEANAGVGLEAKFGLAKGKETDIKDNKGHVGGQVSGNAKAEAGVQGQVELKFSFDATSAEDMHDLGNFFKETAETGMKAAIPGIGPVLAATNAGDMVDAAHDFGRHLETIRGEVGAYANASMEATARAGYGDRVKNELKYTGKDPAKQAAEPEPEGKGGDETEAAMTKKQKLIEAGKSEAAGAALGAAGIDLGSIKASVGGEVNVGFEKNFKTGETTYYFSAKAKAKASAETLGDVSAGAQADYNRKVAVTIGRDGKVADLSVSQDFSKAQFHGVGDTDIRGRVNDQVLAQVSKESKITVTHKYNDPSELSGNPATIIAKHLGDANSLAHNDHFHVDNIVAKETTQFELGGKIAGTGIKLTLGRSQETDVETDRYNESKKAVAGAKVGVQRTLQDP